MDDDFAECEAILRRGSASFTWAARLLPHEARMSAVPLYAFCRLADNAVDVGPSGMHAIAALALRLDGVYRGTPKAHPVDRCLERAIVDHRLPRSAFDMLLQGLEWDLEARRYESFEDVVAYSVRVASSVGVMMTLIMGESRPWMLSRACDLGIAMQLTNIARDVGEDARQGRLYLPQSWMREAGLDVDEWLRTPRFSGALSEVVRRLLDAADTFYRRADDAIVRLPKNCRAAVGAARLVYSDIARSIALNGYDVIGHRAYTKKRRKSWLIAKSAIRYYAGGSDYTENSVLSASTFAHESVRTLVGSCASR